MRGAFGTMPFASPGPPLRPGRKARFFGTAALKLAGATGALRGVFRRVSTAPASLSIARRNIPEPSPYALHLTAGTTWLWKAHASVPKFSQKRATVFLHGYGRKTSRQTRGCDSISIGPMPQDRW